MSKKKRFEIVYVQSTFGTDTQLLIDTETGVQYLFHHAGHAGGMTVLLDQEGKPLLASTDNK